MKSLASLNKYLWKYRLYLLSGIVFIIASNIFNILQAPYVREAVDVVASRLAEPGFTWSPENRDQMLGSVLKFALFIFGAAVLKGVFMFFMRQTIIVMSRHIEYDQKNEIFTHYQRLSLSFYRQNNTGDLMNRISEDVSRVRMYVGPAIMYTINLAVLFILIISTMINVNTTLTLWVLLPLPILSASIYFVNSVIYRRSDELQHTLSRITTFVQEAFSGIRVLKAFGAEKDSFREFKKESLDYRAKALGLARVDALFFPLMMLLIGLSNLLTIYIGGREVIAGNLTYGNIAEFVIYVNMLTWPVASLGWVTSIIQRAAASQERINEFLRVVPEIHGSSSVPFSLNNSIRFKEVSFRYDSSREYVLKDISFEMEKGKTTGVIGATGSGKSTLAALLLRLYDVSEGSLSVDGRALNTLDLDSYREKIGYVPQDVFLFSDSLEENIAFGLKDRINYKEKVSQAADMAAVKENIMDFPEQFETLIGERGVTLSGGQKQRVAIARALVKDPDILILDDCLSAVDTATEAKILANFRELFTNRTVLIISHRVSSVKDADEILVLDKGTIVERGTHKVLLESGLLYSALYERQKSEEAAGTPA